MERSKIRGKNWQIQIQNTNLFTMKPNEKTKLSLPIIFEHLESENSELKAVNYARIQRN